MVIFTNFSILTDSPNVIKAVSNFSVSTQSYDVQNL